MPYKKMPCIKKCCAPSISAFFAETGGIPCCGSKELRGAGSVDVHEAELAQRMRIRNVDEAEAPFVGHDHEPALYNLRARGAKWKPISGTGGMQGVGDIHDHGA